MREQRVEIRQVLVGTFEVFCYVVFDRYTREGVIIDPAGEPDKILFIISDHSLTIKYLLNTHAHADHTAATTVLKEATGALVVMHRLDDAFARTPESIAWNRKMGFDPPAPADIVVDDGQILSLDGFTVTFIHTPGHTPGSCCILVEDNLFTGDTLFVGAVGRTDLPGSSFEELLRSLQKILQLPPETTLWPGHHYGDTPVTTLGEERETNPYITDFIDHA